MKYLFIIAFLLFFFTACKTSKHLVTQKTETTNLVKKDTVAKQQHDSVRVNEHEKITHEVIDTTVQPKPIDTKTSVDLNDVKKKAKEGKADTTDLYDSIGNLLGYIATNLDTLHNKLNQSAHLIPPPIPIHKDVTTKEKSKDSTAVNNNVLTAARTEDSTHAAKSNTDDNEKSSVSAWSLFAAFWWIPVSLICIAVLWLNKTKLITWIKKLLKIQ